MKDHDMLYADAIDRAEAAEAKLAAVRAWSTRWFLGLGGARDELNAILDGPEDAK